MEETCFFGWTTATLMEGLYVMLGAASMLEILVLSLMTIGADSS